MQMMRPRAKAFLTGNRRRVAWPLGTVLLATATLAPAVASDTVETIGGSMRLISGSVTGGVAHLGLAINLKPGWHTYWRYPGDSGVPPELSLDDPLNVAGITVDFPAPMRFGDSSDQTIGYQGSVVLLVNAKLIDPNKPTDLSIHARLGVCRDICVPVDETLAARIDPAARPAQTETEALAAASALIPTPAAPGAELSVTGLKRDTSVTPQMVTFSVKGPSGQLNDVFVEGPNGWALPLPTRVSGSGDESVWRFVLDGLPAGAEAKGATLTFTLVGKARSTTQSVVVP